MHFLRHLGVPIFILFMILAAVIPLPEVIIDTFIVVNIVFSISLLFHTFAASNLLAISTLPTILLITAVCRLCINIATSRNILTNGSGGKMVELFGRVVIAENIFVGVVIFLMLTIVQILVIGKGAERIAEVSARFTLDSLPGRQMSIDADVRSGHLDLETASIKRNELQVESRFYGALDGAMKFVKGDAIAGIIIAGINIIGGLLIGIFHFGLEITEAINRYTLLTIGDGFLEQLSSLLCTIAAAIVVTKISKESEESLSEELCKQLKISSRNQKYISLICLFLSFLPNMPTASLLIIAAILLFTSFRHKNSTDIVLAKNDPRITNFIAILCPAGVNEEDLRDILEEFGEKFFELTGIILPKFTFDYSKDKNYKVIYKNINIFNIANLPSRKEFIEILSDRIYQHIDEFFDDTLTRKILHYYEDELAENIASAIPSIISLTQLTLILRDLAIERVSIKNFSAIIQSINENSQKNSNIRLLTEEVRISLKRSISSKYINNDGEIEQYTMDPVLDLHFVKCEREGILPKQFIVEAVINFLRNDLVVGAVFSVSRGSRKIIREILLMHSIVIPVVAHEEIIGCKTKIIAKLDNFLNEKAFEECMLQ